MRIFVAIAGLVLISGCAMQRVAGQPQDFKQAAAAPLYDVNVLKTKIPVVLIAAEAQPYVLPNPDTCAGIASEVEILDDALGPDLDTRPEEANPSVLARSGQIAEGAAVDLVRGGAQGLVPFRGWIRRLSGAQRADRMVLEAITAGGVRRAFLKGLGHARQCTPPAAPSAESLSGVDLDPPTQIRREPQYPTR
jgi:hypothetical protein